MATITTLIPAYKKEFLGEVFLGLRRQSFKDFRIVLSDDSPGDEISSLIRADREQALFRLGVSEETANLITTLTPAQMMKIATGNTLL